MPPHVSRWPRYFPDKPRDRLPVLLQSFHAASHAEVKQRALDGKLDVYVSDFGNVAKGAYPYLADAVADDTTDVLCTPTGGVLGLRLHGKGNHTAYVGQARSWGEDECATPKFLKRLQALYKLAGVGVYASPGALGQALMVETFRHNNFERISRPDVITRRLLLDHGIGGRVDTPALGRKFDRAWEIDRRNAYAHSSTYPLPYGTATTITRRYNAARLSRFATYFVQCVVYNPEPLTFSPILYRRSSGQLYQASAQGWHGLERAEPVWLWKEEIQEAEKAGQTVSIIAGRGWPRSAPYLAPWAHRMHVLRHEAPDSLQPLVKASIVAAIGRHGMQPYTYRLVPASSDPNGQPFVLQGPDPLTGWDIVRDDDGDAPNLSHWYSYILMQNRLALYRRMVEEVAAGNSVLASNYDATILAQPSILPLAPLDLGGWREELRTELEIPYARAQISDQKKRTPSLSASQRLARYGR